ncbi:hypothetical protein LCM4579_11115 [Ensifer sp. LCM 4579]|nr:hypothetical protein LCM4579_11115 [Ensifer sp. LCM 4579]
MKNRTIDGLKRIRSQIASTMPIRTAGRTLLLGTWNIRNFDDNRFRHGPRLDEAFFYLAEVISAFDILAVQEICQDLTPFRRLVDTLGPEHDYIMTDVTLGESGNSERLGFIYNRNKVSFTGIAGELVLPFDQQISDVTNKRQFARTPFSCTFQSAWFKFNFSTVHIYYGKEGRNTPQFARRVAEIDAVAKFVARRAESDRENAHILVGDFNIEELEGPTFDALAKHGFEVFKNRQGSNATQTKFYDQISFMPEVGRVTLANPESGTAHGVVSIFESVFREEDFPLYDDAVLDTIGQRTDDAKERLAKARERLQRPDIDERSKERAEKDAAAAEAAIEELAMIRTDAVARRDYYLKDWRTYQISDHLPLFVELDIDFATAYLDSLKSSGN